MQRNHTYFPRSTAQQRRLLFETWAATSSVEEACERAHLSRVTFYHWKPRFMEAGYAGILQTLSHRPKHMPRKKSAAIESEVIAMRKSHGEWGKERVADEIAKAHNWVPVVSANTVRRILKEAKMWVEPAGKKKGSRNARPTGGTGRANGQC